MQRAALWPNLALAAACALLQPAHADDRTIWRGHFLVGKAGAQFNPCRSGDRFALEDATPRRALEAAYRALVRRRGQDVRLRAYGFNPFIQLELRATKVLLRLRPAAAPVEYAGAALHVAGGEARLEAASAASVLHLRVRAKPCREELSNGLFSYEVTVEVDGRAYAACAYWGQLGPIPDLAP
jgi:uncharacterized membrane protein